MKGAEFEDFNMKANGQLGYFAMCPIPYVIVGFDGLIKQVNPAFYELLGHTEPEVAGTAFIQWVLADDSDRVHNVLSQFQKGETRATFYCTILDRRGNTHHFEWKGRASAENRIFYATGSIIDQPSSSRHVEEMEFMFRQAQEVVGVGYFSMDLTSPSGKSKFSQQASHILGKPTSVSSIAHSELLKKLVYKEDRRRVYEAFVSALEKAVPFDEELRIVLPNNTIRNVKCYAEPICDDKGNVLWYAGTLLDVSDRKRIEEELRATVNQTNAILDTTVDGIITINDAGCIHAFNKAAEKLFGYKAEEVIGQNIKILMPSPYQEEHDGYIKAYLESSKPKIIGIGREVTGLRKDGSTFPMDLAVSEISGKQRLFTGIVRDITYRKEMQREILQVGEFERQRIGQELHDGLGSQLTGIGMICSSLSKQIEKLDPEIGDEVMEVAKLVKDADYQARNLARGLVPVVAEPTGLVNALQRLKAFTEGTGITCTVEVEGEIYIEDSTISTHLFRIAQEALVNAIKHSKASQITISLIHEVQSGDIMLKIEDDGIGVAKINLGGEGMGLRTMQYRAEMLGAQFGIYTLEGKGTVISCRIGGRELSAYKNKS